MKNLRYLSLVLCLGLSGCSSEPPKCSDKETISILKSILIDHTKLSIDELLKNYFIGQKLPKNPNFENNIFFESIISTAYDEKIKKLNCNATLVIPATEASFDELRSSMLGGRPSDAFTDIFVGFSQERYTFDIMYQSQLNDINQQIVIINNLSNHELTMISAKFLATLFGQVKLPTPKADGFDEESVGPRGEDLDIKEEFDDSKDISVTDVGLFIESSLTLDNETNDNQINGGKVLNVLIKKGVLENSPISSYDYHNYYLAKTDVKVLGARLLAFNHEVVEKWVGCCPNEGNVVLLEVNDSMSEIEQFAKLNKCNLKTGADIFIPEEVSKSNKINSLNLSKLALLGCQEDYRKIN